MTPPDQVASPQPTPFSGDDDRRILDLRNRRGWLWTQIGRDLRRSPDECRSRYDELMHQVLRTRVPKSKRIKCYSCRRHFTSKDPSRNRRCTRCRNMQEGLANDCTVSGVGDVEGVSLFDDLGGEL